MMMSQKKRWVAALIVTLMLVMLIMPMQISHAADVSVQTDVITATMIIKDQLGNVIDPDPGGSYSNVPKDARVFIEYEFRLLDDNGQDEPDYEEYHYLENDYIIVQLPYAVSFETPPGGWDVMTPDDHIMGTLSIDDAGEARITFTDYVVNRSYLNGWFDLEGSFKEGTFSVGDPVSIEIAFAGEIINIGFLEDVVVLNISAEKSGAYDADSNEITWTVTVESDTEVEDAVIVDTFSNNQTYVPGSFMIGSTSVNDEDLTFEIGSSSTTLAYVTDLNTEETIFTYKTKPTLTAFAAETGSNRTVRFLNSVEVTVNDEPEAEADADITLDWVQKSSEMAGTTYPHSRFIIWTVWVNTGGYNLNGAVITDIIPEDLELVEGNTERPIQINGITLTSDSSEAPGTYTYEPGPGSSHTLTCYVGDLIGESATLTFSTRVTNEELFTGNGTRLFPNQAWLNWEDNVSGKPSDSVDINVGQGVLSKTAGSQVNYNHNTHREITWTVRVNANSVPIENAVFTDVIPSGLDYVEDSFTINDPGTDPDPFEGTFSYDSDTRSLRYEFGSTRIIDTPYTITFRTEITDYTPLYVNNQSGVPFSNTAKLTGEGIMDGEITDEGTQWFNSQIIAKAVQTGGYNFATKRVTWRIVVNRNQIPINNAILSDNLPAGMTFLPETFTVSPTIPDAPANALDYTIHPESDLVSQDSFTYTLPSKYSGNCTIMFQTQVKEGMLLSQGQKSFINSATLAGEDFSRTVTATASMTNKMVDKYLIDYVTGVDYIKWGIVVNAGGLSLTDISASDFLQEGLEVDLDSVVLYPMTMASNGTLTRLDTPISPDLYSVTYDTTTRELRLTMPGTHTIPYRLEFITDVTQSPLTISNTVTLSGHSYTATFDIEERVIQVSESGLGGSGVQGDITLEKTGESAPPLSGAIFTLYNNRGEQVAQDVTDENGRIVFGGLPIRTYVLEETEPPAGYVRSEETVRFRMNTDVPNVFYQFDNVRIRADVILLKVSEDSSVPLSGAEYSLFDEHGVLVAVRVTGADGRATFEDLLFGNYTLVETRAPIGYLRSSVVTPINITSTDSVYLTLDNTRIRADVELLKVGENSSVPLSGAEYSLFDENDVLVAVRVTDADGTATFEDLPYGNYTLVETRAPFGYVRSSAVTPVSITSTNTVYLTLDNTRIRADVVVLKIEKDSATPLAGAEFSLFDENGKLVAVHLTGADGKATFESLPFGNYTLAETRAPSGYIRTEENFPVSIPTIETVHFTVTNTPEELPKTGRWLDTWVLLAMGGSLIMFGVAWLLIRRRRYVR